MPLHKIKYLRISLIKASKLPLNNLCLFVLIYRERNILKAYGVPPRMLDAIKLCYQNLKAKVISPDDDTDISKIYTGVMQGDTLAPFLFVTVLDYALRNTINGFEEELGLTLNKRQSRRVGAVSLCDLDFAGYIVLVSDAVNHTQELLLRIERERKEVGLMLNS